MRLRLAATLAALACGASLTTAADGPAWLPLYDLAITFDTVNHNVSFRERVTWTNMSGVPTDRLVFNFSPHYKIPDGDELLLAKTLELLRLPASYGIDHQGRHGTIKSAKLVGNGDPELPFQWKPGNQTGLEVTLPAAVQPNASVTIELVGDVKLPNKQGRWGQWGGISYFTNALPVVAFYDGEWRDVPFVPWHQPFWNEAGRFSAAITLPDSERLACSAAVASTEQLPGGWQRVTTKQFTGRDFAIVSSAQFNEHHATATLPSGKVVDVKCLALGRHDFYARELANIAAAAIPVYSQWFGDFPYEQFTIVESFFGWNGNECSGMVLIDERVFDFPTFAHGYVEYLMSHETCHQWFYNLVGSNGYSETFMDEGAATYFTHRMLDARRGKNNRLLNWPDGFDWMPNIGRENYRNASITGAIRRRDIPAAAGDLPAFGHLYGLFSGAYDRGSRIFGLIESRMGETAFFDFMQGLVKKYSFRVLSAKQLREELVTYTGPQSAAMWDQLYERWVYGNGLVDWKVESVSVEKRAGPRAERAGVRVAVEVAQLREYDEPTTLGFQFADGDGYPVRVPVTVGGSGGVATATDTLEAEVVPLRPGVVSVRVTLPQAPSNITVDPDGILMDADPANNSWKSGVNVRVVPFYTFLYDTDLTNDYDKWNATIGPWYYGALYPDPWYTRATIAGLRAGVYKTQQFAGGVYVGARPDYRDLVFGVDGLWDHWPDPRTQVGFNYERRIAGPLDGTDGVSGGEPGGGVRPVRVALRQQFILAADELRRCLRHLLGQLFAVRAQQFAGGGAAGVRCTIGGALPVKSANAVLGSRARDLGRRGVLGRGRRPRTDGRGAPGAAGVGDDAEVAGRVRLLVERQGRGAGGGAGGAARAGSVFRARRLDAVPRLRPGGAAREFALGGERGGAGAGCPRGALGRGRPRRGGAERANRGVLRRGGGLHRRAGRRRRGRARAGVGAAGGLGVFQFHRAGGGAARRGEGRQRGDAVAGLVRGAAAVLTAGLVGERPRA